VSEAAVEIAASAEIRGQQVQVRQDRATRAKHQLRAGTIHIPRHDEAAYGYGDQSVCR
jgi:hypothetical protein